VRLILAQTPVNFAKPEGGGRNPQVRVLDYAPMSSTAPAHFPPRSAGPGGIDLRVSIGSVSLKNPVIAASGTFGYGVEFTDLVDLNRLGGIVVKGLSAEPMAGNPSPRMCETPSGMVNAIGLQNIGVRAFIAEKLPKLRQFDTAIIANVFGHTISDYQGVVRLLEDAEGLAAYELNISCERGPGRD
jgi:dihydroorotate dehydrogenase (NAD+) catalytic subunit